MDAKTLDVFQTFSQNGLESVRQFIQQFIKTRLTFIQNPSKIRPKSSQIHPKLMPAKGMPKWMPKVTILEGFWYPFWLPVRSIFAQNSEN